MTFTGPGPGGATPLDADEAADLIPAHITTRAELNEWEQANIAKAMTWALRRRTVAEVLTPGFLTELHRRMFDDTWTWAGRYRKTGRNIGVPAVEIHPQLRDLLDDVSYWLEHRTFGIDEIGTRFHHRLVRIHPFPNGNGRHSRLLVDILLARLGVAPFTWGAGSIDHDGAVRSRYLTAVRDADVGDYSGLLRFVRSAPATDPDP